MAFFLRSQETLSGNFLFLLDSGRDMMDVKGIVFDHKLTLIGPYTSLGGVFQGPLYYYLLAIPTFIFQGNPWGNILLMLIISLVTIFIAFYFTNKYFGLTAAVVTFTLFAFSPEAVAAATYFWNPHPMWLILTFYVFALFGALKKNSLMQILLWPLIALSFHFEMAFGFFLFAATFIYVICFQRKIFFNKKIILSLFLSFLLFMPQILFDLRHDFLMSGSVVEILKGNNQGLITSGEAEGFVSVKINNLNTLKHNFISSFIYDQQFSAFPVLIFIATIVAVVYSLKKKIFTVDEKLFLKSLSIIIVIILALGILYPFPLRYWFLTGFQSFYLIIIGLILSKIFKFRIGKIILVLIMIVMSIYFINRINTLYINPPNEGGAAKIKGKIEAIDFIYNDSKDREFGIIIFTPPVITDAYDYLIWWHGSKKYGYIPHSKKSGTVYLLIEPDTNQPWSYKGWLETIIKTGDVVYTKTLSSGIIIQKRNFSN